MSDRMAEFNVRIDARSAKLECWIECTDVRKNERERDARQNVSICSKVCQNRCQIEC